MGIRKHEARGRKTLERGKEKEYSR